MSNYRAILKKAGAVLVAVGAIDIALWVYCTINNLNYSSNFNILTVVIGILLIRGSLKVAHYLTGISAFMLSFTGANLLLLLFVNPAGLWVAEFKFRLVDTVISLAIAILSTVLLAWIYRQLRSPSVVLALQNAGYPTSPPKFAFGIGVAVVIFFNVTWHFTLNGDSAAKAIELARTKYGQQYQYHLISIRWSGNHTSATLAAYSDREIKSVMVEWEK